MSKRVFITGATGHIGSHVARAFRDGGYQVAGLTRSASGAASLKAAGIEPVIGSMQGASAWRTAAESAEVLVHAAVDYSADTFGLDRQAVDDLLAVREKTGARFIYTSGVWMAGRSRERVLTEADNEGIEPVSARREIEPRVLAAGGIVLRPGVVYGERAGLTASWFTDQPVVGDGSNHWAMVNVEDLANGYVLAAEKAGDGELFHLVDDSRLTVADMVRAARAVAGIDKPIEWIPFAEALKNIGTFAEALALDQIVANDKARSVLGWSVEQPNFVNGVKRYFDEWQKAQQQAA